MSFSPDEGAPLYAVLVRHGGSYRELVASCESHDLCEALKLGGRVRAWLVRGWFADLPDGALDLREELEALGFDPAACPVEVVRLAQVGPHRYATDGPVMAVCGDPWADDDPDDDADVLDPTPLERVEPVTVRAWRR